MIRTVKTFFAFLALFVLHRGMAWSVLSSQYSTAATTYWQDFLVGFLSDIWMAAIFSLPFWIFDFYPHKRVRYYHKIFTAIWLIVFGIFTAAHQGYVEYFKFQIIPFHLSYITDTSFVSSNSGTLFGFKSGLLLALTLFLAIWTHKGKKQKNKKIVAGWMTGIVLTAILCHVFNIKWRVNWFVVEPLQMNYVEALSSSLRKKPTVLPVSQDELTRFSSLTSELSPLKIRKSVQSKQVAYIKSKINEITSHNKTAIVGVIIAESLREIDTGTRTADGISITPSLDALQNLGVKFNHAYSSGPVTRGAQEAVWCGTPSATDTSLMRSFPNLKIKCLPSKLETAANIETVWLHGGDAMFDSQLAFWKAQKVKHFLTKEQFSADAPATGWGISDLALFDSGANLLEDIVAKNKPSILMPMFLSVSNHIPWAVPSDASIETKSFVGTHSSYKTIKYFDESLDLFVGTLKEKGMWDRSVFIVVGDHGNLEEPWRNEFENDAFRYEKMLSHVSLTLTGGIIEQLRKEEKIPATVDLYTAQSQIAPFLEALVFPDTANTDASHALDTPLLEKSKWPIVSDLNQYLYLPELQVKLAKEKVLSAKIPTDSTAEWVAMIRYRAWLEKLYRGNGAANN